MNDKRKDFYLSSTQKQVAPPEKIPSTPKDIYKMLDRYVVGQTLAKKILAVAVYNHNKRTMDGRRKDGTIIAKSNVLLIGPTGSGKTYLAETLARILDIPIAIGDATTLTEAGYAGNDVEYIIQLLLQKCNYDAKLARQGIIYIDEIDKIGRREKRNPANRDVSGEGVQQALLKLIEGAVVNVPPMNKYGRASGRVQIDTTNILFICGGMFDGLEKIISKRKTGGDEMGFSATIKNGNDKNPVGTLKDVTPSDLMEYGFIPEFVGRLPIIAALDELGENALVEILTKPKNAILKQYRKMIEMEGCELEICDDAIRAIAREALKRGTGARGLRTIVEKLLTEVMYDLPGSNITKVIIDAEVVAGKKKPIATRNGV